MTDDDGLRPCAQAEFCASATTEYSEEGNRIRVPARGPRAFCVADQAKIAAALAELPRMYVQLAAELGTPARREDMIRSGFGPRVPLRADVDSLMQQYAEILPSWHERVALIDSLSPPPVHVRPAYAINKAFGVLLAHGRLDILLALQPEPMRRAITYREAEELGDIDGTVRAGYVASTPDLSGADAGLEILKLRRRSKTILGESCEKPVELLGVPCRNPHCDMLALKRAELPSDPDEDPPWSVCAACGDTMSETTYKLWTERYARWWNGAGDERPTLEDLPEAS